MEPGAAGWIKSLRYADVVIIIGGEKGSYETYEFAMQEQKPVFAFADTKGYAETVYNEILSRWDSKPIRGFSKDEFINLLAGPIHSEAEAMRLADALLSKLQPLPTSSPTAVPRAEPQSGLDTRREAKMKQLNDEWQTMHDKLSRLRKSKVIETDPATIFKLEKQIAELENDLDSVERTIEGLKSGNIGNSNAPDSGNTINQNADKIYNINQIDKADFS